MATAETLSGLARRCRALAESTETLQAKAALLRLARTYDERAAAAELAPAPKCGGLGQEGRRG